MSLFKTHIGFDGDGYIATRMDADTARDVLGPFVSWACGKTAPISTRRGS